MDSNNMDNINETPQYESEYTSETTNTYEDTASYSEPYEEYTEDGKAVAILVLGILSILCCAPCGIAAVIMRNMYKDRISPEKQGMATGGFVCGIIGIAFWVISIIFTVIGMAAGMASMY